MNKTKAAWAIAFLAGSVGAASAQIIGAEFVDSASEHYASKGVLGESFVAYSGGLNTGGANVSPNTSATLVGDGVSLALSSASSDMYFTYRNNGYTGATNLYTNALEIRRSETLTLTLSGLVPGATYDVAVYGGNFGYNSDHNAQGGTIQGVPFAITATSNPSPSFVSGVNYVQDIVSANAMGKIVVVDTGTASSNYNPISAISIEAVPEPSTWASLALGVGALVGFQRFRRQSA